MLSETEVLIGRCYAVAFLLMGLSHLARPAIWADFIIELKQSASAPVKIVGFTLPFGLVIVLGHSVWTPDAHGVITFFGWLMTVKCVTYLLFPEALWKISPEQRDTFVKVYRWAGCAATVIGGLLIWGTFFP